MKRIFFFVFFLNSLRIFAQYNLDFYLAKGFENSPSLKQIENLETINKYQGELNYSQTSAIQTYLSADYLFAPYFNNNGKLISANPAPKAIGYDIGITNGGLYSAQINVEKNIFNGGLTSALDNQIDIHQKQYKFNYDYEHRNLKKQVTEQYLAAYKSLMIYRLSKNVVKNIESQLNITGEMVEQGYEKSQNYLVLKIELQSQQIALNENLQQYKNDLMQLNSLCGIKDTQTVFIDSIQIKIGDRKTNFNFLEKFKLDSLVTANQQELFETKYKPQIKLFFNTGLNAIELDGIQRKFGLSAGINFQLPILDGGQKDIIRQQNEVSISSIKNYMRFALANIEIQKHNTLSNIHLIRNNLKSIDSQLEEYNELIKISDKQIQTGGISMIEYLTILKNFIDLQKTKIEKEINLQMETNNYNYWNE